MLLTFASCDSFNPNDLISQIACQHRDADDNSKCDKCGEDYTDGKDVEDEPTPDPCRHRDADDNSKCDKCGEDYTDEEDAVVLEKIDIGDKNADLGKYITLLAEDYKGYPVKIAIDPIDDMAIDSALIRALYASRTTDPDYKGLYNVADTNPIRALGVGDTVRAHYIGYTLGEGGERMYFTSNFNKALTASDNIGIGAGMFIPGFELGLIGKSPWEYSQLTKIKEGTVKAGDVISISMLALYSDGTTQQIQSYITAANAASCDAIFGEGFAEFLIGREIGEVEANFVTNTVSDKSGNSVYTDITVEAIYDCGEQPLTVEARFPINYPNSPDLAGKTVYFDVFVEAVSYGSVPEVDEKFITEKIGLTLEELNTYGESGDSLIYRYRAYIGAMLREAAIADSEPLIIEEFFEQMLSKVEIKSLPEGNITEFYNGYIAEITDYYEKYGSAYASLDECARIYCNLDATADWRAFLRHYAEKVVTEQIIFYYVVNREGFWPSGDEYAEEYERILTEIVDMVLANQGVSPDSLSAEEYERWRELIEQTYGEDYFKENVIYEYAVKKIVALADVTYE